MNDELLTRASFAIDNISPGTMCYLEIGEDIGKDLAGHIEQRYALKVPAGKATLFGYPIQINKVDKNVFRLWECKAEL